MRYRNAIWISHHRKVTTLLVLLKKVLLKKLKIIHVAHNEFNNLRRVSLFPKRNIAVSHGVKKNMVHYFKINEADITVIHNGIEIPEKMECPWHLDPHTTNILYPARITNVKNQVSLVKRLNSENLPKNIKIFFAGEGNQEDLLRDNIVGNPQFEFLGYINQVSSYFYYFDYVMLTSLNEGLPITLIEALATGTPIITNNVGGNLEILCPNKNGFIVSNDLSDISKVLSSIPTRNSTKYKSMADNAINKFSVEFTHEKMIHDYIKYIHNNFQSTD